MGRNASVFFKGKKEKKKTSLIFLLTLSLGLGWGCRNGIKRSGFITLAIWDGANQWQE